jgi:putative endonuclease
VIAKKDDRTVFIEIKYRLSTAFGLPEESITKNKLYKCKKTVEYYCKKNRIDFEKIRFDVITILKESNSHKVTHYKNIEL